VRDDMYPSTIGIDVSLKPNPQQGILADDVRKLSTQGRSV